MDIEEKKEIVARQACVYSADLLESKKAKAVEVFSLMNFLSAWIESAEDEKKLAQIKVEVGKLFPSFPVFEPGI